MKANELETKILKARHSSKHGGMWEWVRLLIKMKETKGYTRLGYESFADWVSGVDIPQSTLNTWINLYKSYHVNRTMVIDALEKVEVRILKCFLPLARSDKISTSDLWNLINRASRMDFNEFLKLLPGIKEEFGIQRPLEVNYTIISKAELEEIERKHANRRRK